MRCAYSALPSILRSTSSALAVVQSYTALVGRSFHPRTLLGFRAPCTTDASQVLAARPALYYRAYVDASHPSFIDRMPALCI